MKIGIIREGKTPPDSRVPLTPKQCKYITENYPVEILVQPSPNRCYTNESYEKAGLTLSEDMESCEVLMGVKEVPKEQLIPNKTYFFFSHTIKKQVYNKALLQHIIQSNIRLIDYEVLTNDRKQRLIAFGKFAGMVGAHNGLMTYGIRTGAFELPRMNSCHDYAEAVSIYQKTTFPSLRIVLTGSGRVATGAALVLRDMGIKQVSPSDYLNQTYNEAVFTQLQCNDYVARKDGASFEKKDFYQNPSKYKSIFAPYTTQSDIMINGIYWDNNAPAFFTKDDMRKADFNIKVIADVTCDIAPISSIPSTLDASTIADPIFGYDPVKECKAPAHQDGIIDMMTIDNLPNELPRDASKAFGEQFTTHILAELLAENSAIIERGTVAQNKDLGKHFEYLRDYVEN